jgi:hypothetical protein
MPNEIYDSQLKTLFEKLDKLHERFNEHTRWAASESAELKNEIKHINTQIEQIKEEYRISQKELHVVAETSSEERFRLKEEVTEKTSKAAIETMKMIADGREDAVKKANAYTNRGVIIAVGVCSLIFAIVETIYYLQQMHMGVITK